ncbi:MAG TPA: Fe-S-containing protein [Thermoleophilia bacterium]|nr:Fe-S-containing protein [Thermoleophilia bacterium]
MEAFVITLREGMEAALIVGLVLTYLSRTGRAGLRRWVYGGLTLAAAASLLGAVAFRLSGFDPENEILEGSLLGVAAVLVLSLVVWMWRASRGLKGHVEGRLESLTGSETQRGPQGWALLAFVFFMVFREGVETVLFLAALSLAGTPDLLGVIGGLAGLGLAALFGVLFVKGSLRINLRRFFAVTGFVLMVLVARLLAGSLHEFFEVGLLPSTTALLAVIGFVVKDSTSTLVLIALVALPVVSMLPEMRLRPEALRMLPDETAPERRKRLAELYRSRNWQVALVSVTLAMVLPLGTAAYAMGRAGYRPDPQVVTVHADGMVHISLQALTTGQLNLYLYDGAEANVSFMVIKRGEDDVAVALNACSICPPRGYHQEGGILICDNCNAPINMETVGMSGGCNPIPLAASLSESELLIAAADLEGARPVFATG